VTDDWARAPTANARRTVVYFILIIGSRDAAERRSRQVSLASVFEILKGN
jgi:hypothetical protein